MRIRDQRATLWITVGLAVLVSALIAGPGASGGVPLDPRSTGPNGTKALVMLLDDLGAQVDITGGGPRDSHGTAVLLSDGLDGGQRSQLREWVGRGGTLVVADPQSPLVPPPSPRGQPRNTERVSLHGPCSSPALADIDRISARFPIGLSAPAGSESCFAVGDGRLLVDSPTGNGHIVAIGGPELWVNQSLGRDDNAALAAALLAPVPDTRVAYLMGTPAGNGRKGLLSLVDPRVKDAALQLVFAFVIVVLWRARRLGRPAVESQPVQVPGSEMVLAVGRLWQKGRHRERAALALRRDLHSLIADRIGADRTCSAAELSVAASRRMDTDRAALERALTHEPINDGELVVLSANIESIRQEVIHAR